MRIRTRGLLIASGQGLTQVSALVLSVALVRIISPGAFGTYRQGLLVYTTLGAMLSLQIEQSLYYFVPSLAAEQRRPLLAQSIGLTTGFAALVGAALFFASDLFAELLNNPELAAPLRALALLPLVDRINLLVPGFMIGIDRALRGVVYTVISSLLRVVVVLTAFLHGFELTEVFHLMVMTSGVVAVFAIGDMLRLSSGPWRIGADLVRSQLVYTLPLWLTGAVGILNRQYDKFLISGNFDPATYAVYFCGAIELPIVQLVTTSLTSASMPNLVTLASQGRMQETLRLWQEIARKSSLVIFPTFAFFVVVRDDFMVALYGESYAAAADPFGIYLLTLPLRVGVYAAIFRASAQTRDIAWSAILMLAVNVLVSSGLVWIGGQSHLAFVGPAIGTVAATVSAVVFLLLRLRRLSGADFGALMRWRELGRLFFLCLGTALVTLLLPLSELSLFVRLATRLCVFATLFGIAVRATGLLTEDERQTIRSALRRALSLIGAR